MGLKYNFADDSFNMKDFGDAGAALNTVMPAYNLISLLRPVLLETSSVKHSSGTVQSTPQTPRYNLFVKATCVTDDSRMPILNLTLAMQQRA